MTERRPAHETVPDFVERQILEAQERGDFDRLAGHGRPLPGLGQPDDELWWVRRKLRDEHLTGLPPALEARRARAEALTAVAEASDEATVRHVVEGANACIRRVNRTAVSGPPTGTMPLDVEEVLATWRAGRAVSGPAGDDGPSAAPRAAAAPRTRRWRRRGRGRG